MTIEKIAARIESIRKNNTFNPSLTNYDLYKLISKTDFLIVGYETIKSNKGSTTMATPASESIDGIGLDRIEKLQEQLKDESWSPKPARRVYIPKKGSDKTRPLGIQGPEEKIVQSCIKIILEAIYEPIFSPHSYGWRPRRGCHDALKEVKSSYHGINLLIEGDIQGFFDEVDHKILLKLLSKKIKDAKFIRLIGKLLNAGYVDPTNKSLIKPLTGTPQGSIVSPTLSNIYLHELDQYMENKWITESGVNRRNFIRSPEMKILSSKRKKIEKAIKSIDTGRLQSTQDDRIRLIKDLKKVKLEQRKTPFYDKKLSERGKAPTIRITYTRYADDFIIGVAGPFSKAIEIKDDIKSWLNSELDLTLSNKKTKITNIRKTSAIFLGYRLRIDTSVKETKIYPKGRTPFYKRTTGFLMKTEVPMDRLILRLQIANFCDHKGLPLPVRKWAMFDDWTILSSYNAVYRGYLEYYSGADNQNALYRLRYIMQYSLFSTLAARHRSSISKLMKKHGKLCKLSRTARSSKDGKIVRKEIQFHDVKLNRKKISWNVDHSHWDPGTIIVGRRTRSKLCGVCCICGHAAVHNHHEKHVRKGNWKNPKNKTFAQLMGLINRKQIPVCQQCHENIHQGKYDGMKLSDLLYPEIAKR